MFKKKLLVSALSISLALAALSPLSAMAASNVTYTNPSEIVTINGQDIQPQWKTKVAREAIEKLADNLSNGKFIKKVLNELPDGTYKKVFEEAVDEVSDALYHLAKKGEQGEEYIRDFIQQTIMNVTGAPTSTAKTIANILVLVFL
ncbi:hypothetical protein [Paenibacillus jiagnxiensis]|uniref:hypothetical protein n=1 Tax=Paenibacillus jiagnxiensis TaxID=3228926 RepID=UPI0033A85DA1